MTTLAILGFGLFCGLAGYFVGLLRALKTYKADKETFGEMYDRGYVDGRASVKCKRTKTDEDALKLLEAVFEDDNKLDAGEY